MCCHENCCVCSKVAKVLLIIGGLNWGLTGLGMLIGTNLNVVNLVFGFSSTFEAVVYILVGVAAVMKVFGCKCAKCKAACASCAACSVDQKTETKA